MVRALVFKSREFQLETWMGHCTVFFGKILHSNRASLLAN